MDMLCIGLAKGQSSQKEPIQHRRGKKNKMDMIPIYLVTCWILGMLGGFMMGRYYGFKKMLKELEGTK